jgi:hypothetical protein
MAMTAGQYPITNSSGSLANLGSRYFSPKTRTQIDAAPHRL